MIINAIKAIVKHASYIVAGLAFSLAVIGVLALIIQFGTYILIVSWGALMLALWYALGLTLCMSAKSAWRVRKSRQKDAN